MGTTAVLADTYPYKKGYAMTYASVGDSDIILVRQQQVHRLTTGESVGYHLTNAIGDPDMKVTQVNTIDLDPEDRILLCSDGVTGNEGSNLLSDDEILQALDWRYNAEQAVDRIIRISRKRDDKAAIVEDIYIA